MSDIAKMSTPRTKNAPIDYHFATAAPKVNKFPDILSSLWAQYFAR